MLHKPTTRNMARSRWPKARPRQGQFPPAEQVFEDLVPAAVRGCASCLARRDATRRRRPDHCRRQVMARLGLRGDPTQDAQVARPGADAANRGRLIRLPRWYKPARCGRPSAFVILISSCAGVRPEPAIENRLSRKCVSSSRQYRAGRACSPSRAMSAFRARCREGCGCDRGVEARPAARRRASHHATRSQTEHEACRASAAASRPSTPRIAARTLPTSRSNAGHRPRRAAPPRRANTAGEERRIFSRQCSRSPAPAAPQRKR